LSGTGNYSRQSHWDDATSVFIEDRPYYFSASVKNKSVEHVVTSYKINSVRIGGKPQLQVLRVPMARSRERIIQTRVVLLLAISNTNQKMRKTQFDRRQVDPK
jgi:hypothetical protein